MSTIFSEDHPAYPIVITTNVILTTFLVILAVVVTMIAYPSIQGDLALSDTQSIWLTTLNLLGANLAVPCASWFGSSFGFKRMYTYSVILFTLASLLAALANNFFVLASARLIEGIGGGFIFPLGLTLIIQSLSKARIPLGINLYVMGVFGVGLGFGIPLAGYLTQFESWRDAFFLIVPISSLTAISCWLTRAKAPLLERKPFDWFGFLTFSFFTCTFLIALTMGPIPATDSGWHTPYIWAFFTIAAISLIACIFIERRHPDPIFPIQLFKDPIFSVSLIAMFLLGMATFASVSTSIQYMLNGLFYEKFVTAKIAAVYGIMIGIISVLANYLSKLIPIPVFTCTGLLLLTFSYFYNNELSILTGPSQVIAILIVRGIGVGLALGPTTLLALYGIPNELKSQAATIVTFFRQVGATYGGTLISIISIRQTIFHTARFGEQANGQLPAYKMTFHNLYNKFPDPTLAKAAIIQNIKTQAYIQGLNDAFIAFGYVTAAVTLILILLIGWRTWTSYLEKRMR